MTDPQPERTTTEVRQGNNRKMNTRALIFGLIGVIIVFALVYWFSTSTYDETATTTGAGETIEDTATPPVTDEAPAAAPAEGAAAPADDVVVEPAPAAEEPAEAPAAPAEETTPAEEEAEDAAASPATPAAPAGQ